MVEKQNMLHTHKKSLAFFMAALLVVFTAFVAASAHALSDTTRPTILSVSPTNNELDILTRGQMTVVFSEDMNPMTINANTFTVMQRTTPELGRYTTIASDSILRSTRVDGTVKMLNDRTARFIPNEPLSPNQQYGNVFTVMITTGAKDLAGNSLLRNYVWSYTTGIYAFYADASSSQQNQSVLFNT
jgi:hypothetical protein